MALSSALGSTVGAVPAGAVMPFAGANAPAGWLLCGGQAVSRTDYAALFAVIGTMYGSGNGSTTFNVPDLRGRVVAGEDDMGGTAANRLTSAESGIAGTTLGAAGGVQSVTLTEAQIPSHRHTTTTEDANTFTTQYTTGNNIYLQTGSISTFTGYAGGGSAHNNVQPTMIMNYIIKAVNF